MLVTREDKEGVATLTLDRPEKLNAINIPLMVELRGQLDALAVVHDAEAQRRRGNLPDAAGPTSRSRHIRQIHHRCHCCFCCFSHFNIHKIF